jgi:hypothetical protein
VRDYVAALSGASWPGPRDAPPPLPQGRAELADGELRLWYGDDEQPTLRFDPLAYEEMGFSNRWTARQDEHRAVAQALAAALEERLQAVVPPGFDVGVTVSEVGVGTQRERGSWHSGGPWHFGWGRDVRAELAASGVDALAGVQEGLISMLGKPWPATETRAMSAADVSFEPREQPTRRELATTESVAATRSRGR